MANSIKIDYMQKETPAINIDIYVEVEDIEKNNENTSKNDQWEVKRMKTKVKEGGAGVMPRAM